MKVIAVCIVAAALLAPAASAAKFKDKAAFQAYVAGHLGIRSVSCQKLNDRIADCLGSDGHRYVVACAKPTGANCVIRRYA